MKNWKRFKEWFRGLSKLKKIGVGFAIYVVLSIPIYIADMLLTKTTPIDFISNNALGPIYIMRDGKEERVERSKATPEEIAKYDEEQDRIKTEKHKTEEAERAQARQDEKQKELNEENAKKFENSEREREIQTGAMREALKNQGINPDPIERAANRMRGR